MGVIIFFFFFYFDNNNINPIIRQAFQQICANKLLNDMYCDMSEYINGRIEKKELLNSLSAIESPFAELYKKSFPTIQNASSEWEEFEHEFLGSGIDNERVYPLNFTESKAIVNCLNWKNLLLRTVSFTLNQK